MGMSTVELEVANPVAESAIPKIDAAPRPEDLAGQRIGLYWNYKPGGNIGLDQLRTQLGRRFPTATFVRYDGALGASVKHVTPAQADEIAANCDVLIGATGD
jgi:hypothetical protein